MKPSKEGQRVRHTLEYERSYLPKSDHGQTGTVARMGETMVWVEWGTYTTWDRVSDLEVVR